MDRMDRRSGLEDKLHNIDRQQEQLSAEEASILTHKEKLTTDGFHFNINEWA